MPLDSLPTGVLLEILDFLPLPDWSGLRGARVLWERKLARLRPLLRTCRGVAAALREAAINCILGALSWA